MRMFPVLATLVFVLAPTVASAQVILDQTIGDRNRNTNQNGNVNQNVLSSPGGTTAPGQVILDQSIGDRNRNTNQSTNVNENVLSNTSSQNLSNTSSQNLTTSQDVTTSPVQSITIEGSTNLPQVPGFTPAYPNFTQPYKPDFLNGRKFVIDEMTLKQAEECRDGKVKWYGGDRKGVDRIRFFYDPQTPPVPMVMDSYVGTAVASGKDLPFTPVLCEAAYRAMRLGVTHAFVTWVIRPENKSSGIGFGASAGFSGLPAAGANPYAVAAVAGFGTGMSWVSVRGELMIELTGFRAEMAAMASGKSVASAPVPKAPPSVAQARPEAPAQSEVEIASDAWRGGAYDPAEGTNFGR